MFLCTPCVIIGTIFFMCPSVSQKKYSFFSLSGFVLITGSLSLVGFFCELIVAASELILCFCFSFSFRCGSNVCALTLVRLQTLFLLNTVRDELIHCPRFLLTVVAHLELLKRSEKRVERQID
jgi:hypothetical protein